MRTASLSLHTTFYSTDRPCTDCPLSASSTTTASPTASPSLPSSPLRRLRGTSPTTTTSDAGRSGSRSPSFRLADVLVLLRRRPSKVDMALSEERSRADEDAIERQGLGLMEPRPVDPLVPMDGLFAALAAGERSSAQSRRSNASHRVSQPRFVMGGIFEVMEGRG